MKLLLFFLVTITKRLIAFYPGVNERSDGVSDDPDFRNAHAKGRPECGHIGRKRLQQSNPAIF